MSGEKESLPRARSLRLIRQIPLRVLLTQQTLFGYYRIQPPSLAGGRKARLSERGRGQEAPPVRRTVLDHVPLRHSPRRFRQRREVSQEISEARRPFGRGTALSIITEPR